MAFIVAGGTGLLLGFWLRVYALFAASVGTVLSCIAMTTLMDRSLLTGAVNCVGVLIILQIGYLAGVACFINNRHAGERLAKMRSYGMRRHIPSAKGSKSPVRSGVKFG